MHMVAAMLGCERAMIGPAGPPLALTAWTGLQNTTLTLLDGWFLTRKAACPLNGCMTTDSADYCMLVNERAW